MISFWGFLPAGTIPDTTSKRDREGKRSKYRVPKNPVNFHCSRQVMLVYRSSHFVSSRFVDISPQNNTCIVASIRREVASNQNARLTFYSSVLYCPERLASYQLTSVIASVIIVSSTPCRRRLSANRSIGESSNRATSCRSPCPI